MPYCDAIWHMDADCVFTAPCGPENWMRDGRLVQAFIPFGDPKRDPAGFGPGMWKSCVDAALGGDVKLSTMTGHPHAHYAGVYEVTRRSVEERHNTSFDDYVSRCENTYPQGFCEFETLGATAQMLFHNDYEWIDLRISPHPSKGRVEECWSHGGLDFVASDRLDGVRSPRQLFAELGLTI